jgi:hypothetical protein
LTDLRVSVSRRDADDHVAAETAGASATLKVGDGKGRPGTAAPISGGRGLTVWFVAAWEALSSTARWLSIYVLPWLLRGVLVAAFLLTGL